MVELLDWDAMSAAGPKVFVGFSDITALHAVAAPRAQHRVHRGVAPGGLQIGGPVGVRAREVVELAVPVQHMGCHHRVEIPAAQHVEPGLEPFLGDRSTGGDDGDTGAGGESGGPHEGPYGLCHLASSSLGIPGGSIPKTWAYRESSDSRTRTIVSARRNPCPSPSKAM